MPINALKCKYIELFRSNQDCRNAAAALAVLEESSGNMNAARKYWRICVAHHLNQPQGAGGLEFLHAVNQLIGVTASLEGPAGVLGEFENGVLRGVDDVDVALIKIRALCLGGRMEDARRAYRNCLNVIYKGSHFSECIFIVPRIFYYNKRREWELLLSLLDDASVSNIDDFVIPRLMLLMALGRRKELFESSCIAGDSSGALNSFIMAKNRMIEFSEFGDSADVVFCIGLGKTGTTSISSAMSILGYSASHYINKFTGDLLCSNDVEYFNFLSDTPICASFEDLYRRFARAKFIYTTRDIVEWGVSFRGQMFRSFGLIDNQDIIDAIKYDVRFGPKWRGMYTNLYFKYPSCEVAYQEFDRRVREFFHDKPEKFLEIDISDRDCRWERICEFLDKPHPGVGFPWENRAAD